MNKKLKRIFSCVLAAVTLISASVSFSTGTFAAESELSEVAAEVVGESLGAEVQSNSEPAETPTEVAATEPITTEPTTAPVTIAPIKPAPKVGNVRNVVKTSFLTDKITLEWDKVSGATGYYVYYRNADETNTFKKIAEVKTNTCTISKLAHTTQYHFKVSAFIEQDGKRYEGEGTIKKTATQPGKVSGLDSVRSSSVIQFEWNRNSKATGYKIYRACNKTDAKYVLYKTIRGNSTTSFTDKNVELGRAYYYSVRPFRELYGTSYTAPSNEIKFICGLGAPDYSMTSQVSRVSLSWNRNKYATGYDIYYATSRSGPFKKLGSTTKTFFNTVRLTHNKTYYFRVQPYKINGPSKTKVLGTYATRSKTVTKNAYGQSMSGTYIEISLKQQHMWYYRSGDLYCETDVVTGNDDGYHNTPKGVYSIYQRLSPTTLVGPGYASYVNYWMAFTYSGIGIHDASWRSNSEYGGTTYKGNGSHGCVNTPYNAVKKIYQKAGIGTKVVVY